MRRAGVLVIGVGAVLFGLGTPAVAREPSPTPTAPPGEAVCTFSDSRLIELSGILALPDGGYVVHTDSNENQSLIRVFVLDSKCRIVRTIQYPASNPARDPEDIAVDSTGAMWVADIGDNPNAKERRRTVALWKLPAGANGLPVIHRLAYPDGQHDAEALLFGPNDLPIIVTKEGSGTARLYQATGPLEANNTTGVPLKEVGTFKPTRTGTPNLLGGPGNVVVTGAATSPDRKRVALRTYSDAYEWDVPDGDVVKAITTKQPRVTPLPREPLGEGIAYTADGKSFVTVSDQTAPTQMLKYQPAVGASAAPPVKKKAPAPPARPWYKKLTLPEIINIVAGFGLLGLILVVVGVVGIQMSRKRRRSGSTGDAAPATGKATAAMAAGKAAPPSPDTPESERPTAVMSTVSAEPPPPPVPVIPPSPPPPSAPPPSAAPAGGRVYGSGGGQPPPPGPAKPTHGGGVYGSGYSQPPFEQGGYDQGDYRPGGQDPRGQGGQGQGGYGPGGGRDPRGQRGRQEYSQHSQYGDRPRYR